MGRRPFQELIDKMPPESQERVASLVKEELAEMPLHELRHARDLSQKHLAEILHVNQGSISKMERRADMYISTLRSFIEAMGGRLEITAAFPDGTVRINQFEQLKDKAS
jgi:predicted XRE-type DNA-binding protein